MEDVTSGIDVSVMSLKMYMTLDHYTFVCIMLELWPRVE